MSYGQMIRKWREKKGWTQRQLADAVGCSDGYIAHLENEVKLPSLDICMALVTAFELTSEEEQALLQSVEAARQKQAEQRIRTRGEAVRGALQTRGSAAGFVPPVAHATSQAEADDIAREIAANPDLLAAYENLRTALADPQMRPTVLAAIEAFARAARPESR